MYKKIYSAILLGALCVLPAAYGSDPTYGRIKEHTATKLVIDVDNAPDKSFDLTKESVNVGHDLKIGDPVRLTESKVSGKTSWDVARDDSGIKHGDKTRNEEINSESTYGRIKELSASKLVVDVDNAPDKTFNRQKETVNMAASLKVGDPVRLMEHKDANGNKYWDVTYDESNIKHGDKTRSEEVKHQ